MPGYPCCCDGGGGGSPGDCDICRSDSSLTSSYTATLASVANHGSGSCTDANEINTSYSLPTTALCERNDDFTLDDAGCTAADTLNLDLEFTSVGVTLTARVYDTFGFYEAHVFFAPYSALLYCATLSSYNLPYSSSDFSNQNGAQRFYDFTSATAAISAV